MHSDFTLHYRWEPRSEPYRFVATDFTDVTALELCLERFVALYTGTFTIVIDTLQVELDLHTDFSTIFNEIPGVLVILTGQQYVATELDFYEQGAEFQLSLTRQHNVIALRFVKGKDTGPNYAHIPELVYRVPARQWLAAWLHFLHAILAALVALEPELEDEDSYKEYRSRLRTVEQALPHLGDG